MQWVGRSRVPDAASPISHKGAYMLAKIVNAGLKFRRTVVDSLRMRRHAVNSGRNGERGAIAVLMALCLTSLVGTAALGFDLAYMRLARLELQNATDAASHAALVRLRATGDITAARTMAMTVAGRNSVYGRTLVLGSEDIQFGGWDFSTKTFLPNAVPANAVQILGSRSSSVGTNGPVEATFGKALGLPSASITHSGTAAFRIRSIVVAQDITGSFTDSIDAAGAADVVMLDQLHGYGVPADRIGMQLFTGDGTQFTALTYVQSGYTTVRSQWAGDGKGVYDTTKRSGITVCNKLDLPPPTAAQYSHSWVPACSTGSDGTNPGAAIQRATEQLLAQAQAYETRVVVLITDGRPSCCSSGSCSETNACAMQRAQYGVDMANYAEQNGISIFTVSFGADTQQSAYNASLARGIGVAYNTPDRNQLATILSEIAGMIPIVLVK